MNNAGRYRNKERRLRRMKPVEKLLKKLRKLKHLRKIMQRHIKQVTLLSMRCLSNKMISLMMMSTIKRRKSLLLKKLLYLKKISLNRSIIRQSQQQPINLMMKR
jgi:hypothetical protein